MAGSNTSSTSIYEVTSNFDPTWTPSPQSSSADLLDYDVRTLSSSRDIVDEGSTTLSSVLGTEDQNGISSDLIGLSTINSTSFQVDTESVSVSFSDGFPTNSSASVLASNWTSIPTNIYEDFFEGGLSLHPHWYDFVDDILAIPDSVYYALGIYIAFVGIIGTLGNLLVIWIFATTKSLRSPQNYFLINLAISDAGFSAIIGFPLMTISAFRKRWTWGETACTIYGFLGGLFGFNSIHTLAWIALDRYYVISRPFAAMKTISGKRALIQIIFIWIWSVLWSSPPLFGWGKYIPEGFQVECSFDYLSRDLGTLIHNHGMFWCAFVVPVLVIAFSYISIYMIVSAQGKKLKRTASKMGAKISAEERKRKQEIQTAKIGATAFALFVVSWLPYAIVAQLGVWQISHMVTPYITQIPVLVAKASAMWNPILYALTHPRFRGQLDKRFPWLVCCKSKNLDRGDITPSSSLTNRCPRPPMKRMSSVASNMTDISDTSETDATVITRITTMPTPALKKRASAKSTTGRKMVQRNKHKMEHDDSINETDIEIKVQQSIDEEDDDTYRASTLQSDISRQASSDVEVDVNFSRNNSMNYATDAETASVKSNTKLKRSKVKRRRDGSVRSGAINQSFNMSDETSEVSTMDRGDETMEMNRLSVQGTSKDNKRTNSSNQNQLKIPPVRVESKVEESTSEKPKLVKQPTPRVSIEEPETEKTTKT